MAHSIAQLICERGEKNLVGYCATCSCESLMKFLDNLKVYLKGKKSIPELMERY